MTTFAGIKSTEALKKQTVLPQHLCMSTVCRFSTKRMFRVSVFLQILVSSGVFPVQTETLQDIFVLPDMCDSGM